MKRSLILIGLISAVLILSATIIYQDGSTWRIPDERRFVDIETLRDAESDYCDEKKKGLPKPNDNSILITCSREVSPDLPSIYVWGDSHARHLIAGFSDAYPDHNVRILYFTSCLAQSGIGPFNYLYNGRAKLAEGCRTRNENALEYFRNHEPTSVVIHQYFGYEGQFSATWQDSTRLILSELTSYGHRVAFVGGVVQPGKDIGNCLVVPKIISNSLLAKRCSGDKSLSTDIVSQNLKLSEQFPDHYINPNSFFCDSNGECRGFDDGLMFRDRHHLSVDGSRRLIKHLRADLAILFRAEHQTH